MINKKKPTKLKSEVLKAPDLAQMLGIDVKTVYRHAALGELPSIRIGRQWLFPKKAIFEWLKSGKKQTIPKNFLPQASKELPLFKRT
ncbi:MAG: excisionase family DNA binding domain-containing protein [candidate division CPR1 bacterium GW2011_GWA2_42_17]|uniref:Excisionase family DNA binding domain-containing protein n=1 Tax=candidate division CPR1 bacterium GW2011_GWA2_42_17 TaxID=1618341 RepID=A0A0G0Z624_9BACT|nr:MAG: excisionase family DNA binding domain-containing protein [candidate division CPR1 bacterium GW2011_GWA2_42_17]